MIYSYDDVMSLIDEVIELSAADATEVIVGGGRSALTRFANNELHQSVEETWPHVRVRVANESGSGARVAAASTDRVDREGIEAVVEAAQRLARHAEPTDDWLGMAMPEYFGNYTSYERRHFDTRTADSGPVFRANAAATAILPARRLGITASGYYRVTEGSIGDYGSAGMIAIGNSAGVRAYHLPTAVDFTVTATTASGASGWASANGIRRSDVDPDAVSSRAIERAVASENPDEIEPGPRRVLLEPAAVASLLGFIAPSFSAQAIDEGRSYLVGRIGETIADERVTLIASPTDARLMSRPFDGEGIPTQTLNLIAAGTATDIAIGRAAAHTRDTLPNGYGPMQPSSGGATPRGLILEGGAGSVDDLIARNGDALLVARLWYNRYVDFRTARVTGMTRDGFFELRNGAIHRSLVNMRYNVSVFDLLTRIVDFSSPVRVGDMLVPAIVFDEFELTSATVSE